MLSCLQSHQLVAKFSSYIIEIEWWQSFHYIYQLPSIWQFLVFEVITNSLRSTLLVLWLCGCYTWVGNTTHNMNCFAFMYITAPFCELIVKRHCLPLTRLLCPTGGAQTVNHKATYSNMIGSRVVKPVFWIYSQLSLWPLMMFADCQ